MHTQNSNPDLSVNRTQELTVLPDEKVSIGQSAILGLQHVMAMDVYVVPFLIALLIGLAPGQSSALIQSTFIAAGIATIIQAHFCMKLPVAQGPSYIPIGAIIGIYAASGGGAFGWESVLGASLVGGGLVILLGITGLFNKIIKAFIPPIVGGTIIFVVGLSLMCIGLKSNVYSEVGGSIGQNVWLAIITACVLVACVILGAVFQEKSRFFRISSVIISLVAGCLVAEYMGVLNLSAVSNAGWFTFPQVPFLDFGFSFNLSAIVTMVIIYAVLLAETTGTWFAVSNVIDQPLTETQINKGVIGEGLGCFIASFIGSTPVTGYSTNAGIISITGIASRRVFVAAGLWFVLFGFSGKLAAIISSIPAAVIGGVFIIVCGVIAMSGLKVIKSVDIGEKEMYVIAIPMILTLAVSLMPESLLYSLPSTAQYLLSSPIAIAAVAAILLNKMLPKKQP